MRSSMNLLTLACAGMAAAGPMNLFKKAYVTEIETETVIVYVTAGAEVPTSAPPAAVTTTTSTSSSTSIPITPEVHAAVVTPAPAVFVTPAPVVAVVPTTSTKAATTSTAPNAGTAAGSSSTSSNSECPGLITPTDYASTAVYWHNIHRCNHSAPAVTWDTALAGYAATLAATCNFHHDVTIGGGGYGQNIASYGQSGDVASLSPSKEVASAASEMWYNGELPLYLDSYYGKANPDFTNFEAWGHFTQVVWLATTKIGCASQFCPSGTLFPSLGGWYTVCNYNPAGNVGSAYATNVLKPLGHAAAHA